MQLSLLAESAIHAGLLKHIDTGAANVTQQSRFTNKRAMVTGATRGLGRTIAEWLARDGAEVFISGRNQEDIDKSIDELKQFGTRITGAPADLEKLEDMHELAETALEIAGPFDILINNAGFSNPTPFLETSDADWDAEMAVNVRAPYVITQHIAKSMIENSINGRIVNIGTIGVFAPHHKQIIYDIAKAGVHMMTKNMAFELAKHNITANCVAPGAVPDRPGFDMDTWNPKTFNIPIQRSGNAEDIANAVCFFCQDESSWVSGQTLLVDGAHLTYLP